MISNIKVMLDVATIQAESNSERTQCKSQLGCLVKYHDEAETTILSNLARVALSDAKL